MKSAIICFNCGKLTRKSESYTMRINKMIQSLTDITTYFDKYFVVKICKVCTRKAGYKVATTKKKAVSRKLVVGEKHAVTGNGGLGNVM